MDHYLPNHDTKADIHLQDIYMGELLEFTCFMIALITTVFRSILRLILKF